MKESSTDLPGVADRIVAPEAHTLVPRACEHVTLPGEGTGTGEDVQV